MCYYNLYPNECIHIIKILWTYLNFLLEIIALWPTILNFNSRIFDTGFVKVLYISILFKYFIFKTKYLNQPKNAINLFVTKNATCLESYNCSGNVQNDMHIKKFHYVFIFHYKRFLTNNISVSISAWIYVLKTKIYKLNYL